MGVFDFLFDMFSRAKNMQIAIPVLDGQFTDMGFMVGDGHVKSVITVIHLVNETAEHGSRKEHLARQVNMSSDDGELRVHQFTATKEWYSV